jgi:diguanylate cyclase (GGDEF)-like protein
MGQALSSLSLKTKITMIALGLFLGGIWTLTYLTISRLQKDLTDVLAHQQFASVSYVASEIDQLIHFRIEALEKIAKEITPELLSDPAKLNNLLEGRPLLPHFFANGVGVANKAGDGVALLPRNEAAQGISYKELEYFQQVMATGKPAIGKPRIGRVTKKPGVAFSVPVLGPSSEPLGILVGFSSLSDSSLFGQLERSNIGASGWMAISAPQHGMIVTASDPKRSLSPLPARGVNHMLDRFVDGYEGSGIAVNSMGIETLTSAKWIPSTGWFVQAVLPTQEAYEPIRATTIYAYSLALGLSLLVAVVVWGAIRRMLRPLGEAAVSIRNMAEGRAEMHQIPVSQGDEVGALISSFNLLVGQRGKMQQALEEQARTDALTLLPNRRHFIEMAEAGLARSVRYGGHFSVFMLDLDNFKQINDANGHKAGDCVLATLAELCRQMLRDADVAGRMGGEEFAVMLPETDCEHAVQVAERLRKAIEEAEIPLEGGGVLRFTASIGVTALSAGEATIDGLLNHADKALYKAKHAGRNRVMVWDGQVSGSAPPSS